MSSMPAPKFWTKTHSSPINDLGPSGETWSLNTPSYSDGRIYHRSLKELIAIGR